MPTIIRRDVIRAQINVRTTELWQDQITSATPDVWSGTDLSFQLGLFADGAFTQLVDGGAYSSIRIEVKPNNDRLGAALMDKEVAGPFTAPDLEDWQDGTDEHATVTFTNAESNLDLDGDNEKTFWVVISAITNDIPANEITLGCTQITVKQDGHSTVGTPPTPSDPLYLTAAQSDARYVAIAGSAMSGELSWTGSNHWGLKNISLTTSQRDLLTPAAGHAIYNSTTGRTEFYDNAGWRAAVRLAGDTMAGHLLFTDATYDIGAAGATRPRTGYFSTSVVAPSFVGTLTGAASLSVPLAGGTMTGGLLFTDNTVDIGASGATRPRRGYFGTEVVSPLFTGSLTGAASLNVLKAGDTLTGFLTLHADPTANMHAATRQWVLAQITGAGNFMVTDGLNAIYPNLWYVEGSGPDGQYYHCDAYGGTDGYPSDASATPGATPSFSGADNPGLISRIGKAETLTSKTLTAPVMTDPDITNAVINGLALTGDVSITATIDADGSTVEGAISFEDAVISDGEFLDSVLKRPTLIVGPTGGFGGDDTCKIIPYVTPGSPAYVALFEIKQASGFTNYRNTNFGTWNENVQVYGTNDETAMRLGDHDALFDTRLATHRGAAFGVAALDASAKVPIAQLPDSIVGQVEYQGTWDANANLPSIPTASSSNKGHYYVVATAGTSSQGGITDWEIGDWLISNGTAWEKVDNTDSGSGGGTSSGASPEGAVTASPGATHWQAAGSGSGTFWVKDTGTGNTGWVQLITV